MLPLFAIAIISALAAAAACLALRARYTRQCRELGARIEALSRQAQQAQETAGESAAALAALVDHCGCGIVIVDGSGIVQCINAEARDLLDVAISDPVGRPIGDAVIATSLPELLRKADASREPIVHEMARVGPQAGAVSVTIAPVRSHEKLTGRLIVVHDLSTLRRLEAIRRDFVANVSHELRTPMASIRAMAETLREGALNDVEVADRFLSTIIAESERLTRISDDLLTLSDAESRPPDADEFSLTQIVEQIVRRISTQAESARISLSMDAGDDVRIVGSRDLIEQVVVNLLDNAIKYTPAGGAIKTCVRREGDKAILTVADTGIGILQEHLPRIFERFYRVDKARSRQSGGTGLGLSIVKNIVEAHGGSVSVTSEYNHGTTFIVALPCAPCAL
jgi:two-component system phosphate regulon sensor histidine kinase PhoR